MAWPTRRTALAGSALLPFAAQAQGAWPERPVRWVVPFPPGGGVDIVARLITARLTESEGKPFVVENIVGGSGVVGSAAVARAEPDGHTLLFQTYSSAAVNPAVMRNLPHDPIAAFAPISLVAMLPMLIVVNPSVPARNIQELLALFGPAALPATIAERQAALIRNAVRDPGLATRDIVQRTGISLE